MITESVITDQLLEDIRGRLRAAFFVLLPEDRKTTAINVKIYISYLPENLNREKLEESDQTWMFNAKLSAFFDHSQDYCWFETGTGLGKTLQEAINNCMYSATLVLQGQITANAHYDFGLHRRDT